MARFLDGPAKGICLALGRCPVFLRVVVDAGGDVDALDQPDDEAKPTETIYAYRQVAATFGRAIACTRGRGCLPVEFADYQYHDNQPPDAVLRDNSRWQRWAQKEYQERFEHGTNEIDAVEHDAGSG